MHTSSRRDELIGPLEGAPGDVLLVLDHDGQGQLLEAWPLAPGALDEARLALDVDSPFVARAHTIDTTLRGDPQAVLLVERVVGPTLDDIEPPSLLRRLIVAAGVAEGVAELHRAGVIHQRLRVQQSEEGALVPVLVGGWRPWGAGIWLEGPAMAPPEWATLKGAPTDPAWDVWSLGVLLSAHLTGQHPFGELVSRHVSTEPDHLEARADAFTSASPALGWMVGMSTLQALLTRCFALDPRQRPTAEDLARCLRATHGHQARALAEIYSPKVHDPVGLPEAVEIPSAGLTDFAPPAPPTRQAPTPPQPEEEDPPPTSVGRQLLAALLGGLAVGLLWLALGQVESEDPAITNADVADADAIDADLSFQGL